MSKSKFLERVERRAPSQVRIIDQVSGSPAVVHLLCESRGKVKAVTATRALARRGLSLLRAKRAVEGALEHGVVAVLLPTVEDQAALTRDIEDAGLGIRFVSEDPVDVRSLRDRLALSREQFALRFNLPVDTVEKWETGDRQPDAGAQAYLRVIARDPRAAMAAQEIAQSA